MKISTQTQGFSALPGSPEISLALTAVLVLAGTYAAFTGSSGDPAGTGAQITSALDLFLVALVAGLSLNTLGGFAAGTHRRPSRDNRWARASIAAVHVGLLLIIAGYTLGQVKGVRGQVLVPRFGTSEQATLVDGTTIALPAPLVHQPATGEGEHRPFVQEASAAPANAMVFQEGQTVVFPDGLNLYPAGELRLGAKGALRVLDRNGQVLSEGVQVKEGDSVRLPEPGVEIQVTGLWENWNDLGPTARLLVNDPTRRAEVFFIHRALPGWDRGRGGERIYQLTEFTAGREYLRFRATKDPGLPLTVAGGCLLFAGALAGLAGCCRGATSCTVSGWVTVSHSEVS